MPALSKTGAPADRIAASCAALVVLGLVVFLLVRNERIADPQLFFALRVVLSFSVAVLGATIPGFLDLRWSGVGLAIRAGGALALFVLTFAYTPNVLSMPNVSAGAGGVAIGTMNGGTLNMRSPASGGSR